ncbi:Paired amphipathic helix protein Sin3b [Bienertia sinuspersici]
MYTKASERDSNGGPAASPPLKPDKFNVYQNPALSAALTTTTLRPSSSSFILLFSLSFLSVFAFSFFSSSVSFGQFKKLHLGGRRTPQTRGAAGSKRRAPSPVPHSPLGAGLAWGDLGV